LEARNKMTNTPPNSQFANFVELTQEEFDDVYKLLKLCLAAEMGIDAKQVPDGTPFIDSCRSILNTAKKVDDGTSYDMRHGFVPLFERLHNVKNSPVTKNDGVVYRVEF
jgi:hypothetical protein